MWSGIKFPGVTGAYISKATVVAAFLRGYSFLGRVLGPSFSEGFLLPHERLPRVSGEGVRPSKDSCLTNRTRSLTTLLIYPCSFVRGAEDRVSIRPLVVCQDAAHYTTVSSKPIRRLAGISSCCATALQQPHTLAKSTKNQHTKTKHVSETIYSSCKWLRLVSARRCGTSEPCRVTVSPWK